MGAKFLSWWQQIKQHRVTILVVAIILVVVIGLIIVGYRFDWTGFNENNKSGKTLWDWLQLLIIPLALAVIAVLFNRSERKNEQRIASDNQQEAALQEYIKEMSELLLHEKLRESKPEEEVRKIARLRTLTVLPGLNGRRKGSVLQLLYEASLIDKDEPIVNLRGADFKEAHLFRAGLSRTSLSRAHLEGAHLWHADLSDANLEGTRLQEAGLEGVDLSSANLIGANVSPEQWNKAKSLKGATMPDGSIHP